MIKWFYLLIFSMPLVGSNVIAIEDASEAKIASYGTWESPITATTLAEGSSYIPNMFIDGQYTYLCEMRPANHGRYMIIRLGSNGDKQEMTPLDFDARTSVHEYGGGAFTVSNGVIYASNGDDHAIYVIHAGEAPKRLTEGQTRLENGQWQGVRFADMVVVAQDLVAIGEQHESGKPVQNFLALIDTTNGTWKKLASGCDFYSSPSVSPDGRKIAWICWNHPNMPWTNTELWMGELNENGELVNTQQIGSGTEESFFQPQWSPDGILYFVTDRENGWWNIYRYQNGKIENVCPIEAEVAEPLWTFGLSTYAFLKDKILFAYNRLGKWNLGLLDPKTKTWQSLNRESSFISQMRSGGNFVQFFEQYPNRGEALLQIDENKDFKILMTSSTAFEQAYISLPQHISFPSNGRIAYGFYYPPCNQYYKAPDHEKPPLIVMIHGGPTWQTSGSFQLEKQFWTSRGFAILDVNYGGSTGYGRKYRQLLDRNWGVVDLDDCVHGALYLAEQGLVDKNKMAIRGKSSGGYTTLAALAFRDIFKAGASYYGIADLTSLAKETHKFEQKYMEQLVGKYPEDKALWEARSPINSVHQIHVPLILFQGEEDSIVPKNQSLMIYELLKQQGIPVDLYVYPGEGHGFRQAEHIIHSLNHEAQFYIKVFGIN